MKNYQLATITTTALSFDRAVVKLSRYIANDQDLQIIAGLTQRHFNRAEKPLKIIRQYVSENLEQS